MPLDSARAGRDRVRLGHYGVAETDVRQYSDASARLGESLTLQGRSGNPLLELLAPRECAVIVLLAAGLTATETARLLHISRETLYQDRRRAWAFLRPEIPARVMRDYEVSRRPRPEAAFSRLVEVIEESAP